MATVVLDRFPVPGARDWPGFLEVFWRDNVIVHGRARRMSYDEHPAPLSVKCVFAGEERYRLGRLEVAVDPETYLVINRGHRYTSQIDAAVPVDSLAVCFRRGFVAGALAALVRDDDRLLDAPDGDDGELALFERRYRHDDQVTPVLRALRGAGADADPLALDEQLHALAVGLLAAHRDALREAEQVPASRPATRAELFRRLCRARDLIDSCYAEAIDLDRLAAVACVSPHHLLRQFAAAFGVTPARYLARRRLAAAAARLRADDAPVATVATAVGFTSHAAFSRAFRREHGVAPRAIRNRGKVGAIAER